MIAVIAIALIAGSGSSGLRPDLTLTVERSSPGRPIPAGFLGLSTEYDSLETYAGTDPAALNPIFLALVRSLAPGQSPVVRIGGDSTDKTWWPVAGLATPPGIRFTLDRRWLSVARAFASALRARLILGINLEAASTTVARAEADALLGGLGRASIRALEPGNEPELYGSFAWYRNAAGVRVTGRPHGYDYSSFVSDFTTIAAALPNAPLAGPAFGNFVWTDHLANFLAAVPRLGMVTLHRYPLQKCFVQPSSPRYPTITNLLSPSSSAGLAARFTGYAATAHAHHLPLRIDELNTVSCGAIKSVSRTFAAALWAPDALFSLIRAGVDGVNVHTFPRGGYELFSFSRQPGRWVGTVYPGYYGLLLFADAAPAGSRLLAVSGSAPQSLPTWATLADDGSVRVLVINKDRVHARIVGIRVPGHLGKASLLRLEAPSASAAGGISLGGASFGSQTTSGTLSPHPQGIGSNGGRYVFRVPAASAALLTVGASR